MKRKIRFFIGILCAVLMLSACGKQVTEKKNDTQEETKSSFLGDAVVEEDGELSEIGTAEDGWEEARDKAWSEATSDGKKAPSDRFDRGKAEEIVKLVNEERARKGLGALVIDEAMMTAAETRAQEQKTLFSHTRPDGSQCFTVFAQYEIPANYRGENLASGTICPSSIVMDMWIASEGHYANIINERFTRIGVGYFESGNYGYWAQLFAN